MKLPDEDYTSAPRIHDMPTAERPREKLARFGPGALCNAELLALFISTGTKGRSAIEIGRKLIARYGNLGTLGSLPLKELAKEHGLGVAKASKLAAAFELGARVAREQVTSTPLEKPDLIHDYFAPSMRHLTQEQLIVACLDSRLFLTSTHTISIGTVNSTTGHPRDILRPVIAENAYGFILIHNHPSGDPTPSEADTSLTRRINECARLFCVFLLDHVIIGRPADGRLPYYSFREAGLIQRVAC